MRKAGATMIRDLRLHVYNHLQKLSLRYYESRQTGDIMSRVTGDVSGLERLITRISDRLVTDLLGILISMAILFSLNISGQRTPDCSRDPQYSHPWTR